MKSNIERHPYCPMRHDNGNCKASGGFCTSLSEEMCHSFEEAFRMGFNAGFDFSEGMKASSRDLQTDN